MSKKRNSEPMGLKAREASFRSWVASVWFGHFDFHEPGLGSSPGYPDVSFLIDAGRVLPVELKPVSRITHQAFFPENVRPAQVGWHTRYAAAGGISFLAIGAEANGDYRVLLVPGARVHEWEGGFRFETGSLLKGGTFTMRLKEAYYNAVRSC